MTPLFFGSRDRRLFGIFEPAAGGMAKRSAVLCHAWGVEYLHSHRSMRRLGNMLAMAGWNVLRFDYFGTGDSGGEMHDTDIPGWERDIETAIEEARDTSGASTIALVGLRLGGTLAYRIASKQALEIDALVMWNPVVVGTDFLDQIWALECKKLGVAPRECSPELDGGRELLGTVMPAAFVDGLRGIDLTSDMPRCPRQTLVLVAEDSVVSRQLKSLVDRSPLGVSTDIEMVGGPATWFDSQLTGAIPVQALQKLVEWLT